MMSFSTLRLILKSCQKEIAHGSKIILDFCVDVNCCDDSPRIRIHSNEDNLRTCIGTSNTFSLSHVLKSVLVNFSMKIRNSTLQFKLRKDTGNMNLRVLKINLSLEIYILLSGHRWSK